MVILSGALGIRLRLIKSRNARSVKEKSQV
jgi:hypothetical protein